MTSPKPLDQFMKVLLASPVVQEFINERFGKESTAKLAQFQSGDTNELHDLLINNKQEIAGFPEETHQSSDGFDVELWKLGPVFWLRANEFDDMGYFESLTAARDYAEEQFGPLDETDEDCED
jgi:hypothetical protein